MLSLKSLNMNAWLLTWEGTSGPALIAEKKIVAIISARKSLRAITEVVDVLYCRSVDTVYDMALLANQREQRYAQYRGIHSTPKRLFYGRNPFIHARVVSNLRVERDEIRKLEFVRWTEPACLKIERSGALPVEAAPPEEKGVIRSLEPLSKDIYERGT